MTLQQRLKGDYIDNLSGFYNGEISVDTYGYEGERMLHSSLKLAENVDISDGGCITKRLGYKLLSVLPESPPNLFYMSPYNQLWIVYNTGTDVSPAIKVYIYNNINESNNEDGQVPITFSIAGIPAEFIPQINYDVMSAGYNELYLLNGDVFNLKFTDNNSGTLTRITTFDATKVTNIGAIISKDKSKVTFLSPATVTYTSLEISAKYKSVLASEINPQNELPFTQKYKDNKWTFISGKNLRDDYLKPLNQSNLNTISLDSTSNGTIGIQFTGKILDESTGKVYQNSVITLYNASINAFGTTQTLLSTTWNVLHSQFIRDFPNSQALLSGYYTMYIATAGVVTQPVQINITNGYFLNPTNIEYTKVEDPSSEVYTFTNDAIILHQRMIVFTKDLIYFGGVGNYNLGVTNTGTPVNAQTVPNISYATTTSTTIVADGVAYGSSSGVYFLKFDVLNGQSVPYLSFVSSLIPIPNGLFSHFNNLIVVTKNGIFSIQVDDFVRKDVALERSDNTIRTEKSTPFCSHIFKSPILEVKGYEDSGELNIFIFSADGNIFKITMRHILKNEHTVTTVTRLSFSVPVTFSAGIPTSIYNITSNNKTMIGYKVSRPIYTEDQCRDYAYLLLDDTKCFMDFYTMSPIQYVESGKVKIINNQKTFIINKSEEIIGISINELTSSRLAHLKKLGTTFHITIEILTVDLSNGIITFQEASSNVVQGLFPNIYTLDNINLDGNWLLVGSLVEFDITAFDLFKEGQVPVELSYYNGSTWNNGKLITDSSGNYNINTIPKFYYGCLGLPYQSRIRVAGENYALAQNLRVVGFYSFATPKVTLKYDFNLDPNEVVLNNLNPNYYYHDVNISSRRNDYFNTAHIELEFQVGAPGNINKIILDYYME